LFFLFIVYDVTFVTLATKRGKGENHYYFPRRRRRRRKRMTTIVAVSDYISFSTLILIVATVIVIAISLQLYFNETRLIDHINDTRWTTKQEINRVIEDKKNERGPKGLIGDRGSEGVAGIPGTPAVLTPDTSYSSLSVVGALGSTTLFDPLPATFTLYTLNGVTTMQINRQLTISDPTLSSDVVTMATPLPTIYWPVSDIVNAAGLTVFNTSTVQTAVIHGTISISSTTGIIVFQASTTPIPPQMVIDSIYAGSWTWVSDVPTPP
jgi:hypothetical protein